MEIKWARIPPWGDQIPLEEGAKPPSNPCVEKPLEAQKGIKITLLKGGIILTLL